MRFFNSVPRSAECVFDAATKWINSAFALHLLDRRLKLWDYSILVYRNEISPETTGMDTFRLGTKHPCIVTCFLCGSLTHILLQEGDIEPPAPYETAMTLSHMLQSGETMVQPFVSPAVLQANETGKRGSLFVPHRERYRLPCHQPHIAPFLFRHSCPHPR